MSACGKLREKLVLHYYDELSDVERAELDAHLHVCSQCRTELAALQRVQAGLQPFSPSDKLLQPMRRALFYKLRSAVAARRQSYSPWWRFGKLALPTSVAIALVFLGFTLGRQRVAALPGSPINDLLTASRTISVDDVTISPLLVGINKIAFAADGTVEISYNTLNSIRIQGDGSDPAIQRMLHQALLTENDPIVRLRAVKALEKVAHFDKHLDDSYFAILQSILGQETNLGVKLSVVDILRVIHPQPQAQNILVNTMLTDENEAVRLQAFKALVGSEYDLVGMNNVLTTTKSDSNTYIRTKSLELLKKSKGTSL